MKWDVWECIEKILEDLNIAPILAVIPDNHDETLKVHRERDDFWEKVRTWKKKGWSIGWHGLHHRYCTGDAGLMKLNCYSEFAGLPYGEQESKLREAMQIFGNQGVKPDIWVAPAHSFDDVTLSILKNMGMSTVSDGYSFFPYVDGSGIMWVPQQLWKMRRISFGVWTVCHHLNSWNKSDILRFHSDMKSFKANIVSLEEITKAYQNRLHGFIDSASSELMLRLILARRKRARDSKRIKPE